MSKPASQALGAARRCRAYAKLDIEFRGIRLKSTVYNLG